MFLLNCRCSYQANYRTKKKKLLFKNLDKIFIRCSTKLSTTLRGSAGTKTVKQ